jgi:type III pantothenate kinase
MPEPISSLARMIAVDVGNSRLKWGLFISGRLVDVASLPFSDPSAYDRQLSLWGFSGSSVDWSIASVNDDGSKGIREWIEGRGFTAPCILQEPRVLPLRVELQRPEAVGIDRLLDAVAVNDRRPAGRPAVIVDAGSAITVDAVSAQGSFAGGTIAIGLSLAGRALHEFTYFLPLVSVLSPPAVIGKSTIEALESGLFWGAVGSVKELVSRVSDSLGSDPVVYVTGGDGERLAPHLGRPVELVPHLTLQGMYLASQHVRSA